MKQLIILVLVLLSISIQAQEVNKSDSTEVEKFVVEDMPRFKNGNIYKWISERIEYPEEAKKQGIQGEVYIKFTIEKDGKVTEVEVARGVNPYLDKEAVRLVKSMPKWIPAKHKGKKVRCSYCLVIRFNLK